MQFLMMLLANSLCDDCLTLVSWLHEGDTCWLRWVNTEEWLDRAALCPESGSRWREGRVRQRGLVLVLSAPSCKSLDPSSGPDSFKLF